MQDKIIKLILSNSFELLKKEDCAIVKGHFSYIKNKSKSLVKSFSKMKEKDKHTLIAAIKRMDSQQIERTHSHEIMGIIAADYLTNVLRDTSARVHFQHLNFTDMLDTVMKAHKTELKEHYETFYKMIGE